LDVARNAIPVRFEARCSHSELDNVPSAAIEYTAISKLNGKLSIALGTPFALTNPKLDS
jgi:hypothetical protein